MAGPDMARSGWLALAAALLATGVLAAPASDPDVDLVVHRAGAYVFDYQSQLSGIVAEEVYVQDVSHAPMANPLRPVPLSEPIHRELKSDFLLIKPADAAGYVGFRDVYEVDGKPVRDRQERLTSLFLDPSKSAERQIEQIVAESARYNIGNVRRTVNTPTLALFFLDPDNRPRFEFKRATDVTSPLAGVKVPNDTWIIAYREIRPDTLIRTTNNGDLPAQGRFWIEPQSGRVRMTELQLQDPQVRAEIDVAYGVDGALGVSVPIEMRERYDRRRDNSRIDGSATYSNFRKFQVTVDERIRK